MTHRQLIVSDKSLVPEGFVPTAPLFPYPGRAGALSASAYSRLLSLANTCRIPSYKVQRFTSDKGGPVYVPSNWRELVEKARRRKSAAPKVEVTPDLFTASAVSSSITEVTPIPNVEPKPLAPGMTLLGESLAVQKELLDTMKQLLHVWGGTNTTTKGEATHG